MFKWLRNYLRGVVWPIIVAMIALIVISILAVHAAEQADPTNPSVRGSTVKQVKWVFISLAAFFAVTAVPYKRIGRAAYPLFAATLVMLGILAAASKFEYSSLLIPAIRGSHRWINLGFGLFQPSEIAKLTFIILLAWYLRYGDNYRRFRGLIIPFALTFIPLGLVLVQPDLGTSLLFLPTLFFMLFMAGAKIRHLLVVVAVAAVAVFFPVPRNVTGLSRAALADRESLAYWSGSIGEKEYVISAAPLVLMKPHQLRRIEGWLRQGDEEVAMDEGFQLQQSMIILGTGGLWGQKAPEDKNLYFRWLPDDHTDFIYAVIGGQWGFLGCVGVMLIYVAIFFCGAEIAGMTNDPFGRLLVVGVLGLLLAQILINVGMTMGLTPITGMTLPMISYGGSSMLVNCLAMGLMVNVAQRRPILLAPKPFEYGRKRPEDSTNYGPLFEWNRKR